MLIIGGGPAGSSLAIHLAACGVRSRVIERSEFPRFRIGESLPPKIEPLLAILGVQERVLSAGFVRMMGTTVFQGIEPVTHDFHPQRKQRGFQVERARFDSLLLQRAQEVGCSVEHGVAFVEPLREGARVVGARVKKNDAYEERRAKVVVDASGSAAVLAKALGLRRRAQIRTVALAAYWKSCRLPVGFPATNTLFEMLPDGWIWSVLRADGQRNVTLGLDAALIKDEVQRGKETIYEARLRTSKLVGPLLADAERVTELSAHDATGSYAERYAGEGYLICGDAAAFIDPLTSQGVYKAIQSGIVGATVLNTVLNRPRDAAMAMDFYQHSQERFARNYGEISRSFYLASPFKDRPFWRARAKEDEQLDLRPDAEVEAGRQKRQALVDALETHGGRKVKVRATAQLQLLERPQAGGRFVERHWALVGPEGSVDVQRLNAKALFGMLDGRPMEEVFEGYAQHSGEARSSSLGKLLIGALLRLTEEGLLEFTI